MHLRPTDSTDGEVGDANTYGWISFSHISVTSIFAASLACVIPLAVEKVRDTAAGAMQAGCSLTCLIDIKS